MIIQLTDKAKAQLTAYQVDDHRYLRIGVTSGGCSGMTYTAAIEDGKPAAADEIVYEGDGLRVVADARSSLFLDGLQIDYSDDLIQAGFRLTNPNANKSCGCGSSFAV